MKKTFIFGMLASALAAPVWAQDEAPVAAVETAATAAAPAAEVDEAELLKKVSYAFGMQVVAGMKAQGVELDATEFTSGASDMAAGEPKMTVQEAQQALMQYQEIAAKRMREEMDQQGEKNVEQGDKFLEDNSKKEGVTTTESGLQYEVLKAGDGAKPAATDVVKVHYHGTLTDGTVFDSSVERGEPVSFPLNRVIPGWTEGVQLMPVGAKYKFTIPSDLAYGERGAPPKIGPNAVLQFEVELLEIEAK